MHELIKTYLNEVKREVRQSLSASPFIIRPYTRHLMKAEGKYLRAQCVILSALKEGTVVEDAIKLAAGIELVHLASLVHDDVMDQADKRRGIETLNHKYSSKLAVICGDYLLAAALKMVQDIDHKYFEKDRQLADYLYDLTLGELRQYQNNGNLKLSVQTYLKIIEGKTAALFEASVFGGALIRGEDSDKQELYKQLGHSLGMIFQITDDCMNFSAGKNPEKKPIQSDFEQGVITLPLIYALKESESLRQLKDADKLSQAVINQEVRRTKSIEKALKKAEQYFKEAEKALNQLGLNEAAHASWMLLLNQAMRRV